MFNFESNTHLVIYFLPRFAADFLLGTCASALPAAIFDALLVRLSRNTFEAALAAFGRVTLFVMYLISPYGYHTLKPFTVFVFPKLHAVSCFLHL